jgi:hypothetical protein
MTITDKIKADETANNRTRKNLVFEFFELSVSYITALVDSYRAERIGFKQF